MPQKFDPLGARFDVLVPWLLNSDNGSSFSRLDDIVFQLRSLQVYGMTRWIRKIHVLFDDRRHGPPPWFKPGSLVAVVPYSSIENGTRIRNRTEPTRHCEPSGWKALSRIPGLAELIVFIPQHTVLRSNFSLGSLFHTGRILVRDCSDGAVVFGATKPFCPFAVRKSLLVNGLVNMTYSWMQKKLLETNLGVTGSSSGFWVNAPPNSCVSSFYHAVHGTSALWLSFHPGELIE